jgi:hypothetical protein
MFSSFRRKIARAAAPITASSPSDGITGLQSLARRPRAAPDEEGLNLLNPSRAHRSSKFRSAWHVPASLPGLRTRSAGAGQSHGVRTGYWPAVSLSLA